MFTYVDARSQEVKCPRNDSLTLFSLDLVSFCSRCFSICAFTVFNLYFQLLLPSALFLEFVQLSYCSCQVRRYYSQTTPQLSTRDSWHPGASWDPLQQWLRYLGAIGSPKAEEFRTFLKKTYVNKATTNKTGNSWREATPTAAMLTLLPVTLPKRSRCWAAGTLHQTRLMLEWKHGNRPLHLNWAHSFIKMLRFRSLNI